MENPRATINREILPVEYPTFFLCAGVSGAGCTTAVWKAQELGFARLGPTQFVTRQLRPSERRGDQYYSVTYEELNKVRGQIAIRDEIYGNTYGFFKPAIERIKKTLAANYNVILNAENTPQEWRLLLGSQHHVASLFFAPLDPQEAVIRMLLRGKMDGVEIDKEELEMRIQTNTKNISRVLNFDYWIDTSVFEETIQALQTAIDFVSRGRKLNHARLKSVQNFRKEIEELKNIYQQPLTKLKF